MAAPQRIDPDSIIGQLLDQPHRFEFAQAVRLLLRTAEQDAGVKVRFRSQPSNGFSVAEVDSVVVRHEAAPHESLDQEGKVTTFEILVSFFALTGAHGVLPDEYTDVLLGQLRHKEFAFADYLNIFEHRLLSLFFYGNEKHDFVSPSDARSDGGAPSQGNAETLPTKCLYSLAGLGLPAFEGGFPERNDAVLHYLSHFADRGNSAEGLQDLLAHYYQTDILVRQNIPRWVPLAEEDITRLSQGPGDLGRHAKLGESFVAGTRIHDIQNSFRIQVGPLDQERFCFLLPTPKSPDSDDVQSNGLRPDVVTRLYVGNDLDFDFELLIDPAEIPQWTLGSQTTHQSRLGWTTWLDSRDSERYQPSVIINSSSYQRTP